MTRPVKQIAGLLTTEQVAALWNCALSTVLKRMKNAAIRGHRSQSTQGSPMLWEPKQIARAEAVAKENEK